MEETGLILEHWVSTYEGSKENFGELLSNVDEPCARARPIAGRHTIWEIVNHCTFWLEAASGATDGAEMPPRGDDWPPTREGEWGADVEGFRRAVNLMIRAIRVFDMERLHEGVPGVHYPYSFFEMFFRVAYHNIHHGGQIAILRPK